jgi:hypothetical protein
LCIAQFCVVHSQDYSIQEKDFAERGLSSLS